MPIRRMAMVACTTIVILSGAHAERRISLRKACCYEWEIAASVAEYIEFRQWRLLAKMGFSRECQPADGYGSPHHHCHPERSACGVKDLPEEGLLL